VEQFAAPLCWCPDFDGHRLLHYAPMARVASYDGDFGNMPLSVRRAHEADRSYYPRALCRSIIDTPKIAWTVTEPNRMFTYGNHSYRGSKLIELALQGCAMCQVQWDCAKTAIDAGESAGTWGDSIDQLNWLARSYPERHVDIIEMARSTGVTVQKTIRHLRSGLT